MSEDEIKIFEHGVNIPMSLDEYTNSLQPHIQFDELVKILNGWSDVAASVFLENGFSYEYDEECSKPILIKYGHPHFKLSLLPNKLPSNSGEELIKADRVLRQIHQLHEALMSGEINRVANTAINVGLAVCEAHVYDYEDFFNAGLKVKTANKHKTKAKLKEEYLEWWKTNPDVAKTVNNINDIIQIKPCDEVEPATLRKWFKEAYPEHILKVGSPKNKK